MIRLAVRCTPEAAELVLAELTVLAPNGVEEERGPGYVEYAIYGGEGELPELGEIEAVVGGRPIEVSATEIPDDWADLFASGRSGSARRGRRRPPTRSRSSSTPAAPSAPAPIRPRGSASSCCWRSRPGEGRRAR